MRTAPKSTSRPSILSDSPVSKRESTDDWHPVTVYRASGYHIPKNSLDEEVVEDALKTFTHRFYNDKVCEKCRHDGIASSIRRSCADYCRVR